MYSIGRTPSAAGKFAALFGLIALLSAILIAVAPLAGAQNTTITPTQVGDARLGSTLAELQAQLGPGYDISAPSEIIVDGSGVTVSRDGVDLFHAIGTAGPDFDPDEAITLFIVESDTYATAAGIGPGSTVAAGEAAYGQATLSYHTENESREFARFENQPGDRMSFRTGSGPTAGIYPDGDGPFHETTDYHPDAEITSVWVSCVADLDCPPSAGGYLPDTGADTVALVVLGLSMILGGWLVLRVSGALATAPSASVAPERPARRAIIATRRVRR